jgi:hypothetical protein
MGKWLDRAINKGKSESENYQDLLKRSTDRTDKTPRYESGWEKCFPVEGEPFWRKEGQQVQITGEELERLKAPRIEEAAIKERVKNENKT